MGGDYYDRDVETTDSNALAASSAAAATVYRDNATDGLHEAVDPKRSIECTVENPIVVAVDVTGSMGDWPKIMWDKLPMFFGQILMQDYLSDPAISFAGVADGYGDVVPLTVTEFSQGVQIDEQLGYLGIGGGGTSADSVAAYETYELAAYYYARKVTFPNATTKPILFFTGDEAFYPVVKASQVLEVCGDVIEADIPSEEIFAELRAKYEVFHIHKEYAGESYFQRTGVDLRYPGGDDAIIDLWAGVVGRERVLVLESPRAVVDVMLGAIALISGTRQMASYVEDMVGRGQDDGRIAEVSKSLEGLAESMSTLKDRYAAAGIPFDDDDDDGDDAVV